MTPTFNITGDVITIYHGERYNYYFIECNSKVYKLQSEAHQFEIQENTNITVTGLIDVYFNRIRLTDEYIFIIKEVFTNGNTQ